MESKGRCLCGAVTITGHGAHKGVHVCHCQDCARWNGGPLMAVEFEGGIDFDGPVRWYKSSDWGERGSCLQCGSALLWRMPSASMINVAVGCLDDRSIFEKVDGHIFIDRKPAFYDFADDSERLTAEQVYAKFTGQAQ